ncbi:YjzC family protein [Bacillus taeanensis]|uniref:YjzC family protein n=1 Tax=Bacillus taeanensis TaxID=273032 RepID=A0A366XT43_9BACI|nr:YjzC family protein [Bacillus taeanensis]RBW68836.1 YjzC family protein [Bacillus taeanensis]
MANRFKTGEQAPETGTYEFVGLAESHSNANPTSDEKEIRLESGDTFPPLRSSKESAYWQKSE